MENQDNYLLIDTTGRARFLQDQRVQDRCLDHWPPGWVRLAVMDGIGGHGWGRQVTEAVAEGLCQIPPASNAEALGTALDDLHLSLRARFQDRGTDPGCTLTLLDIPPQGPAQLFHVGDSRLYEIGPDIARCLTIDQVPATGFAMRGQMDADEWEERVHVQSQRWISQAFVMGSSLLGDRLQPELVALNAENLPPFLTPLADRRSLELRPNCLYLLASDGFWPQAEPQYFIRSWPALLARPERSIHPLLDDLFVELIVGWHEDQHLDNATAVAIRVRG